LEAGFLVSRLKDYRNQGKAEAIDRKANVFIGLLEKGREEKEIQTVQQELFSLTVEAWRVHFKHYPARNVTRTR